MLCVRCQLQHDRDDLEKAIRRSTAALITASLRQTDRQMILIDLASVVTIRFDELVTCPALSLLQALRPVESLLKETICQRAPDDLEVASRHLREALELLSGLHLRRSTA